MMAGEKLEALRFETTPQRQVTKQRDMLQSFNREVRADRMGPNPGYKKFNAKPVRQNKQTKTNARVAPTLEFRPKGVVSVKPKASPKPINNEFARKARMDALHARVWADKQRAAGDKAKPILTKSANREFSR